MHYANYITYAEYVYKHCKLAVTDFTNSGNDLATGLKFTHYWVYSCSFPVLVITGSKITDVQMPFYPNELKLLYT